MEVAREDAGRRRGIGEGFAAPGRSERPGRRASKAAALIAVGALLAQVLCTHASPIQFTKEPKSQDALHGRSAMLRCEVSDTTNVHYSWLHDGQPVTDTQRRFQEGGNLKFTIVDRRLDSGSFQCVARHTSTGEESRSTNASFNIKWLESGGVTLKEPASEAEIQSSSAVTLRCHIDGHPRPTCQWFRDGTRLTERSHQINNKERTLTLASASPDDNGVYTCCGKNAAGQLCSQSNFTLGIVDKSFPQPTVIPQDQVVLRNEEAAFHCQFSAEPPPVVEWYHENELVSNKTRVAVFTNGTLLITQVKLRSTGLYKCVARGPRGPTVTLQATLRLAELEDISQPMTKTFAVDTMQRVACRPPRGHPEPDVWWERDGSPLPSEGRVRQDGLELVFSPTQGGDSGDYICCARNKAGQRRQLLTVTVATAPQWVTKPEDSQLEEGRPGYLHCHTTATPDPVVTWHRNQAPITAEDTRFKLFPNGTLRINSVEVYDSQMYSCQSRTPGGMLQGHARVLVLEKLKFTPTPQPLQCLELGKALTVQCSAKGREKPIIHWTMSDGSAIPPRVEQNGGTLHFSRVRRSDAGNYTCIASNSLQGEIRAPVHFAVAEYIQFKLGPENTTVYQGHTAILHCQATGDPEPYIQWRIKDKFLDPSTSRFQKMPNGSLVIQDVGTEDTGKYACIAGNSCNIRSTLAELYVVEKPVQQHIEENEKAPYKMIQTIGLSVGAAVAYIIVVLGLMFYCKKRRNAKRLQKSTEREEPEMECLNGGAVQQNGQTTAEIQDEVAFTNLGTAAAANKQHSSNDKLHFPREKLHTITTLGKGEFGDVLLARAQGIEEGEAETVVLLKSLQARDEQLHLDFRRECDMFGKLSHPNVARLLGLCREAEPHYMILEYGDLGDLKQFLRISKSKDDKVKPQPLSTKQKVAVCAQVAQGMEHLADHRLVHRDLAARNCLISSQRQVKVSALRLSKDVYNSEYFHYRQAWIPLRWLPAESVFEDDFSTKTDVWSFGVLMWEVFSLGELPYTKLGDDEVLEGLQAGKLKLANPEGCPSKVYKLMVRCWACSPKERPSFSELVNALGEVPSDSKV
ncbi:inactive tyrosine-protein kinase 7-like [Paramormyrops kingsleyae]|uniref:Inactive tyrosine-protein kinase 7 n=1 Tax=Paramormyrops kingsleyae TaxID=1676925 RepID=A0A3B3T811_9TELE|nr:inactive tyrosine-protein kinase 7-like [Paramormyrops kingsleyae]